MSKRTPTLSKGVSRLEEFHKAFGHPVGETPNLGDQKLRNLRLSLIKEEAVHEFENALVANDIVAVADALGDALVVILGAAVAFGIPIGECFDEIMDSNMSKLGSDGKPIYREDGKILKGPNYRPPDIKSIIEKAFKKRENDRITAATSS